MRFLGMDEINGRTVFKGATGIGVQSEYQGQARIFPKGSYEEWEKVVEEEVMGQIPLEFLLAVSVSGMLVDCLKEKISISNVIVHCVGESSTGKTTVHYLLFQPEVHLTFWEITLYLLFRTP